MLSRKEMVDIIRKGESVILNGNIIDKEADLPSEAQLAKGDKNREKAALASLDEQIKALEAQKNLLKEDAESAKTEAAEEEATEKTEKSAKSEKTADKTDSKK